MTAQRNPGDVVALVAAAGVGARLGETTPKAFVALGGRSLLSRSVEGLLASGAVSRVVVLVAADMVEAARAEVPDGVEVLVGGVERTDSVRAGLAAVDAERYVLVHDAARALTPPAMVARVVEALRAGHQAVVPAIPVVDTVKTVDGEGAVVGTPDRASLRAVQTPQGFAADLLKTAYGSPGDANPLPATDDAALVERLGVAVHTIEGDRLAFKITTPLDLVLAKALVGQDAPTAGGAAQ